MDVDAQMREALERFDSAQAGDEDERLEAAVQFCTCIYQVLMDCLTREEALQRQLQEVRQHVQDSRRTIVSTVRSLEEECAAVQEAYATLQAEHWALEASYGHLEDRYYDVLREGLQPGQA